MGGYNCLCLYRPRGDHTGYEGKHFIPSWSGRERRLILSRGSFKPGENGATIRSDTAYDWNISNETLRDTCRDFMHGCLGLFQATWCTGAATLKISRCAFDGGSLVTTLPFRVYYFLLKCDSKHSIAIHGTLYLKQDKVNSLSATHT